MDHFEIHQAVVFSRVMATKEEGEMFFTKTSASNKKNKTEKRTRAQNVKAEVSSKNENGKLKRTQ